MCSFVIFMLQLDNVYLDGLNLISELGHSSTIETGMIWDQCTCSYDV